jgi:thioredoxin reductase
MKWYADWVRGQIVKLPNVKVELNHEPEALELKEFDIVVNATGASSYVPQVFGDAKSVVRFEDVLACPKVNCEFNPGGRKMAQVGEKVLVWGDHYAAVDTAQFLASIGKEVTIVTENPQFAAKVETIHMYVALKRFALTEAEALEPKPYKHGVTIMESSTVINIAEGKVTVQNKNFDLIELPVDTVVTCHVRPNTDLYKKLIEEGIEVVNVGDSVEPRNLLSAVHEGATFGKNVDGDAIINPNHAPTGFLPIDVFDQLTR